MSEWAGPAALSWSSGVVAANGSAVGGRCGQERGPRAGGRVGVPCRWAAWDGRAARGSIVQLSAVVALSDDPGALGPDPQRARADAVDDAVGGQLRHRAQESRLSSAQTVLPG